MFIIFELMYLLLLNSCIYSIHVFIIFEYMYLLFLTIKLFLCFYLLLLKTSLLLYPFYDLIGERAKRARHSQVCSIENRIYIYIMVHANFVLITRKEGGA